MHTIVINPQIDYLIKLYRLLMQFDTSVIRMLVNGRNLYVEQYGTDNGPAVVLLHHGLGSVRAWQGQKQVLAEVGYRILAYDRWGYGRSDSRPGLDLPTFTTDLEDLNSLLDKMGIQHATLVGHSDGGTIALYYAAQHPQRISCLVTVAAHIYVEPEMEPGFLGIKQSFETDEHFRMGMRYAHGDKYETVFRNWFDGWYRIESFSWDMRPLLGQIRCPALIVQGDEDEYATPQHAQDIASSIHGSELCLFPGAKHMVPQENTVEFNARILQFLEDHTSDVQ
jgi:pimeloyl-ACP methyl ester carboxylesterase